MELRPHQVQGRDFLRSAPRTALFDEAGTGKTAQLLTAASGPTLVVAPAMVLDGGVWADEHTLWAPELEMTTASYHQLIERVNSGRVSSTGNKIYEWTETPRADLRRDWGTIIFDEAHHLKGRKSLWTAAAETLAKPFYADRVIIATGTPMPNWAHELYIPLRILHPDEAKPGGEFGSYWRWAEKWFPVGPQYSRTGKLLTHHHVTPEMRDCSPDCPTDGSCEHWARFRKENLGDLVIARTWDDLGYSLPPLTGWDHPDGSPDLFRVKMVPEQRKVYRELKKQFVAWADNGTQIEAWSTAGLQTQLRKAAVGLEALDPSLRGSGKLDAMQELLADRGRPTVVVAHHHATLDAIRLRCDELGLESAEISGRTSSRSYRRETIQRFKRGDLPVLIGQIQTVSEGLTLTRADMLIMVEHSYSPHVNEQVKRKLWRLGQERSVRVVRLTTDQTLDPKIIELIGKKTENQLKALPPSEYARLL